MSAEVVTLPELQPCWQHAQGDRASVSDPGTLRRVQSVVDVSTGELKEIGSCYCDVCAAVGWRRDTNSRREHPGGDGRLYSPSTVTCR